MLDEARKKVIAMAFVVIMVVTVFAGMVSIVAICSSGKPQIFSYDGRWEGSASYDGEVCGNVWFNVSENMVETFGVYLKKKIPFDIIDFAGEKIGNGTQSGGIYIGINTAIVNAQFNYKSSSTMSNKSISGVFTSDNNANGTWVYIKRDQYGSSYNLPPITWNATKLYTSAEKTTPTAPKRKEIEVPSSTPTPTPWLTPAPTATEIPALEEKEVPGFQIVFAIAGLLAVAYLLRRKK